MLRLADLSRPPGIATAIRANQGARAYSLKRQSPLPVFPREPIQRTVVGNVGILPHGPDQQAELVGVIRAVARCRPANQVIVICHIRHSRGHSFQSVLKVWDRQPP